MDKNSPADRFVTPNEIREITGMKRATVYKKIHEEIGFYQFSSRKLYVKYSDLLKWMETKKRGPQMQ